MNIRPGWSNLTTANPTQSNHKKNNLQGNGSRLHYHNNCFNNDSDISFRHQTSPNNNNTKLSVGQNGINEEIRDSQSLPPKERGILDHQILEVLRAKV
jgi:hypothetical protein